MAESEIQGNFTIGNGRTVHTGTARIDRFGDHYAALPLCRKGQVVDNHYMTNHPATCKACIRLS